METSSALFTSEQKLAYKIKMLADWQLAPLASHYLAYNSRIEDHPIDDRTNPQQCIVVYSPNIYQKIIDEVGEMPAIYEAM